MESIEQQIQAKGLTGPRVTLFSIEAAIASEHYFTAADGYCGATTSSDEFQALPDADRIVAPPAPLDLLTFCVLVMKNGFTVTGESACASPENFDAVLGRKIAREAAIRKVWPLLGYELRTKLAGRDHG